jgi:NADH-quinone oxidoreductase subunit E
MSSAPAPVAVPATLSADARARIEREAAKYPPEQRQSTVMIALAIAQEEHGWLPSALMEEVASILGMAPVRVYEVATFYNMYNLKPLGRHKVLINQTSADGRVTLKEGECQGACGDAPLLVIDNTRMCGPMTPDQLDLLLEELQ